MACVAARTCSPAVLPACALHGLRALHCLQAFAVLATLAGPGRPPCLHALHATQGLHALRGRQGLHALHEFHALHGLLPPAWLAGPAGLAGPAWLPGAAWLASPAWVPGLAGLAWLAGLASHSRVAGRACPAHGLGALHGFQALHGLQCLQALHGLHCLALEPCRGRACMSCVARKSLASPARAARRHSFGLCCRRTYPCLYPCHRPPPFYHYHALCPTWARRGAHEQSCAGCNVGGGGTMELLFFVCGGGARL